MAARTARKSPAKPVKTAVISYVRELPGAVFFGVPRRSIHVTDRTGATHEVDATSITSIDRESLLYAARLQRISRKYGNDDCQEMLWHDLSQMGFSATEIREFVTNPSAITSCGYAAAGSPLFPASSTLG